MNLIRLALPTVLVLYFLYRSLKSRIFLLGIPFLMYMNYAVFFNDLKPFWLVSKLDTADHVMLWLVLVWVIYFDLLLPRHRRTSGHTLIFGPRLSGAEEIVLVGLAADVVLEIALTAIHYATLGSAVGQAKPFIYLLAGYFLLRGIAFASDRSETVAFISAIVVVNTLAAGLFVLDQGLHVHIYEATVYQTIFFAGHQLTRSFYFMPQMLGLAMAFVIAKWKWSLVWVGVFVLTMAAIWISYTRSLLLVALAEIVVILAVRIWRAGEARAALRRAMQIVVIAIAFGGAAFVFLPTQSQYFLSRIESTTSKGSAIHDANLQVRLSDVRTAYDWVAPQGHLIGAGFVSAGQDPHAATVAVMTEDIVWALVVYRLGLVGAVLVAALYGASIWRAVKLSSDTNHEAEFLSLVLLGTIVASLLEGGASWSILDPTQAPMALWFLPLLVAEAGRRASESHLVRGGAQFQAELGRE